MPSSTQSPTTNTTTTITSPPSTTPSEPSTASPKPFRLLDLPFELVSQILEHSIEGVSSETEPIEISFSSLTPSTSIIEEEEEKEEKTTTPIIIEEEDEDEEEEKEPESIPLSININLIEMKYPPHHHNTKKEEPPHPHPAIFQTCRILRYEGPSPPPKNPRKKTPTLTSFFL